MSDSVPLVFPGNSQNARRIMKAIPDAVTVWIVLDIGEEEHFADVLDHDGERLFTSLRNDETGVATVIEAAAEHGVPALVIDQPGSIAQLAIALP
jgi:hypothetical protein